MLAGQFLRLSVIYALIGMALGIFMAASGDHGQMPTHAHINLLGYVSMFLFGLFYRSYPEAADGRLPAVHFWLSNAGLVLIGIGLAVTLSGYPEAEIGAIVGSFLTIISMAVFSLIVFRSTRKS